MLAVKLFLLMSNLIKEVDSLITFASSINPVSLILPRHDKFIDLKPLNFFNMSAKYFKEESVKLFLLTSKSIWV